MAIRDGISGNAARQAESKSVEVEAGRGVLRDGRSGAVAAGVPNGETDPAGYSFLDSKSVKRDKDHFSRRLSTFSDAKEESERIAGWAITEGLPARVKRANEQRECGAWLWFRRVLSGELNGETFLHRAYFCQQTTCPLCARRKAYVTANVYLPKLLGLWAANVPLREAHFVTLTQRHRQEDVQTSFGRLDGKLKRLTARIRQQRNRQTGPLANIVGGLGHIETKRGKGSGCWHPHYHGVWFTDGRPDYRAMQAAWGEGCHFTPLDTQKVFNNGGTFETGADLAAAFREDLKEVIKYPLKFEPGAYSDIWKVAEALHTRRKLRPFGQLLKAEIPEDLADQVDIDWETTDFVELAYKWAKAGYVLHAEGKEDQTNSRRETSFDAWNQGESSTAV